MKLNFTEEFLLQMAITYLGMLVAQNSTITSEQKAVILTAIAANQNVLATFAV